MLGRICGKPVLGLPGYPLAAQTALREFAAPLLESWGFPPSPKLPVKVRLAQALTSDLGFDEFVPVFVGRIGSMLWGTPHAKGSGVQMATVKANGYTHIPAPVEGYEAGHELDVFLTTDPGSVDRTLFLPGSIDPALEELSALAHNAGLFIHASNVGNEGGFFALKRNACHAAPLSLPIASSLLSTGSPFARQHLPVAPGIAFVHIAKIEQGIASREGLTIDDLPGVRFVNTRKDSPSRHVFDALLRMRNIPTARINGYLQEVYGPQAVAAAIRNGFADAGMCTSGIAERYGLRFVPMAYENYELAVQREMLADPRICTIVGLIRSPAYRAVLKRTGGYDISHAGIIRGLADDCTLTEFSPTAPPAGYQGI